MISVHKLLRGFFPSLGTGTLGSATPELHLQPSLLLNRAPLSCQLALSSTAQTSAELAVVLPQPLANLELQACTTHPIPLILKRDIVCLLA